MSVNYFKKLVEDETIKLNELCNKWSSLAAENENIPETSKQHKGHLLRSF